MSQSDSTKLPDAERNTGGNQPLEEFELKCSIKFRARSPEQAKILSRILCEEFEGTCEGAKVTPKELSRA